MLEFDNDQHMAVVMISMMNTTVKMPLDLKNIRSQGLLKNSHLDRLSDAELKALLQSVHKSFVFDPKAGGSVQEQFLKALSKACDNYLCLAVTLDPVERAELLKQVKDINAELLQRAGAKPQEFRQALTSVYNPGVHHLTMDDDFIEIRRDGKVVEVIGLPGNDRNDLKNFLRYAGGERCLSQQNGNSLKDAINTLRKTLMRAAAEKVANMPKPSRGLTLKHD